MFLSFPITIVNQFNVAVQVAAFSNGINQVIGQSNWAFLKR